MVQFLIISKTAEMRIITDPGAKGTIMETSKFARHFPEQYGLLKSITTPLLRAGIHAADVGCGNSVLALCMHEAGVGGTLECWDLEQAALETIPDYPGIALNRRAGDANAILRNAPENSLDLIFLSASAHELDPGPYTTWTFFIGLGKSAKKALRPGGHLVIGDFFYPPEVTEEAVEEYRERQLEAIGHADERGRFVDSQTVALNAGERAGLTRVSTDIVPATPRIYYVVLLKKEEEDIR